MLSRAFSAAILTLFFLNAAGLGYLQRAEFETEQKNKYTLFSISDDKLEIKVGDLVNYFTRYLEDFNDRHLGDSAFGRFLHYDDIKPKIETETARSRSQKKMSMAMMPMVFHMGATSTWMMMTTVMAAKGVLIGLALLVFKIATSSAKLASFFTLLKGKHEDHHSGWSWSAPPHEYHGQSSCNAGPFRWHAIQGLTGHDRSFSDIEHKSEHSLDHPSSNWHSYSPEWTPNDIANDYRTIPISYNHADIPLADGKHEEYNGPYLRAEERKKITEMKMLT